MKRQVVFLLLLINMVSNAQSVGIGTSTPSPNAILDITSTDKGLMLPRLKDTSAIDKPTAGLLVYDKISNAPNYYNGTQWRTLADLTATNSNDSITYSLSGGPELPVKSFYQNASWAPATTGTGSSPTTVGNIAFSKNFDINSNDFTKSTLMQTHFTSIEFKFYKQGGGGLYYSVKASSIAMLSYNYLQTNASPAIVETWGIDFTTIGFKDWVNNKSFSFNTNTHTVGTY